MQISQVQTRFFKNTIFYVLLLSFFLNVYAIGWGLPSRLGWAMDEILPYQVWDGMSEKFSNGWYSKYAPFHFYLLSILYFPVWTLSKLKILSFYDFKVYTLLYYAGRGLSLAMGTASIYIIYLCGRQILSQRAATLASLISSLMVTIIYYSKMVNLDMPYVFWFCLSLLFYIKILKYHRLRDYILFSATAVTSVCTKDQAYGLYILTVLFITLDLYKFKNRHRTSNSIWKLVFDRRIYYPIIVGVLLFVIFQNLLFNWEGFIKHVELIVGGLSHSELEINENKHSIVEHIQLFYRFFTDLIQSFGWPLFVICVAGIIRAFSCSKFNKVLLNTLVFALSYYIFFLGLVVFSRDRFLIPVCIIMSLFGGQFVDRILCLPKQRIIVNLLVFVIFIYSFFYGSSVNLLMQQDSRYYVESWMQQNLEQGSSVTMYGIERYLPRKNKLEDLEIQVTKNFDFAELLQSSPKYIVKTSLMDANNFLPSSEIQNFFERLDRDDSAYKVILNYKAKPLWNLLSIDEYKATENPRYQTGNLNKINPEITILELITR